MGLIHLNLYYKFRFELSKDILLHPGPNSSISLGHVISEIALTIAVIHYIYFQGATTSLLFQSDKNPHSETLFGCTKCISANQVRQERQCNKNKQKEFPLNDVCNISLQFLFQLSPDNCPMCPCSTVNTTALHQTTILGGFHNFEQN